MASGLTCGECGKPLLWDGRQFTTLIGTLIGPNDPHRHDPNCVKRYYECANKHARVVSIINRCPAPGCEWRGKTECWCSGPKVEEWPE